MESTRTHFEVLGLEASSPRKLACPRFEDSTIFWIVKILWSAWKIFVKTFFFGDRLKNFCEDLFFCFFRRALALVSLASSIPVLGLESVCPRKGCPWPRALCPRLHLCDLLHNHNLLNSNKSFLLFHVQLGFRSKIFRSEIFSLAKSYCRISNAMFDALLILQKTRNAGLPMVRNQTDKI